jgi:hypothetical protein
MKKYIKTVLIPLNVKNLNNRIYTKDSFKDFPKEEYYIEELPTMCARTPYIQIEHIKGVVKNARIEDNALVGDVTILKVPFVQHIEDYLDNGRMVVRPMSTAKVNEDGVVIECNILGFQFIMKDADSFSDVI